MYHWDIVEYSTYSKYLCPRQQLMRVFCPWPCDLCFELRGLVSMTMTKHFILWFQQVLVLYFLLYYKSQLNIVLLQIRGTYCTFWLHFTLEVHIWIWLYFISEVNNYLHTIFVWQLHSFNLQMNRCWTFFKLLRFNHLSSAKSRWRHADVATSRRYFSQSACHWLTNETSRGSPRHSVFLLQPSAEEV